MQTSSKISDRKKINALIAGLMVPGLGQIYNGELAKGLCLFAVFLAAILAGTRMVLFAPDALLSTGFFILFIAALAIYVAFGIEAWITASHKGAGYACKWYNTWYSYTALWLLCSVFITGAAFSFMSENFVQSCRIVTASMQPAVIPGDFVIVDKTFYKHKPPARGDIILFRYPADRSKLYIKRIEGLPGDTMKSEAGNQVVPRAMVFVLGGKSWNPEDPRQYEPVFLADVLGKARQVYFSFDFFEGVRRARIGKTL